MTAEIRQGDASELVYDLEDDSVTCVVTDPPFGMNYVSRRSDRKDRQVEAREIASDGDLESALDLFMDVALPLVEHKMVEHSDLYVFTQWQVLPSWIEAIETIPNLHYKMLLVWAKGDAGMGDIDANWGCGHELILYCKKGRRDIRTRRPGIIAVDRLAAGQNIHPTEKPVGLMERLIEQSTDPGDLVVDPFSGSGATIVAAQNLGRRGIGFELDDDYVAKSRSRLTQMSFGI